MAIGTGTAILGGALLGAAGSYLGGKKAADAADRAAGISERQFDIIRQDTAPYRHVGTQALNALASMYGYSPYAGGTTGQPLQPGARQFLPSEVIAMIGRGLTPDQILALGTLHPNQGSGEIDALIKAGLSPEQIANLQQGRFATTGEPTAGTAGTAGPDYSAFFKSPDYEFRRGEGIRGIENLFSARGGARSGNALRALTEFSSNLAGSEFGNYFNRQASLAGLGQTAVGQSAQAGQNYAGQAGNALIAGGNARASGIQGIGSALGGGLQDYLLWNYLRPRPVG